MGENNSIQIKKQILESAKAVLDKNWVDLGGGAGFTKPTTALYPFQWNWDSGFIAYGYSHYDLEKAIMELSTLFKGQWTNGFLPHIIFHSKVKEYFPNYDFWDIQNITNKAPEDVLTSGITQPPIHAMAIWHIYKELKHKDAKRAKSFLEEFYPKLYKLHKYLHTQRDPEGWGMVTIYHPWESGFDNSPRWDEPLSKVIPKDLPKYKRFDIYHISSKYRPTDKDYDQYVYLALNLKNKKYNDKVIYKNHPFKIKDSVFSSILYLANKRLKQISEVLNKDISEIENWMKRFEDNFYGKSWNKQDKLFYDYDINSGEQIKIKTIGGLIPMITGLLTDNQMKEMSENLDKANFCGGQSCAVNLVPSIGIKEQHFNNSSYWRGPVWINVNWLLWKGFLKHGMDERAKHLQIHILKLVSDKGFWEYYAPLTSEGIGAKDFSWSAALAIDLLYK